MHADDALWAGDLAGGYVRATATLAFQRVAIPLTIVLVPALAGDALAFRVEARAGLQFDSAVAQWISDKLGGGKLATRLARRQIDAALVSVLAPPPPFELPGGGALRFVFCGERPEITAAWAALPFAVELGGTGPILPPRLGPAAHPSPAAGTTLALDLDLDALNAMLYELWRTGYLDRRLADVGLDRRFNTDPLVTELLTVRLSPVTLALPPVVTEAPDGLRLAADARVTITDGDTRATGRVWGALAFRFARGAPAIEVGVARGVETLALRAPPDLLVPCYGDLVDAMRGRTADFHGALTVAFADLLGAMFTERHLGDPRLPAELVIHRATPSLHGGVLRLDLDAGI